MNKLLTPKQREVLEWIEQFLQHHQTMPSRREIALGLGLSSPATIQQHIEALEEKGFLKRGESRESRALQYTAKSKKILNSRTSNNLAILPSSLHPAAMDLTTEIPLLGTIAAGYPIEVYSEVRSIKVPLELFMSSRVADAAQKDVYMLSVRGDSMMDEGILPNDLVLLRKGMQAKNGDTVAALWNGEATLKKFFKTKQGVELHPANPKYPVMKILEEDRFEIQGILVGVIRKYEN